MAITQFTRPVKQGKPIKAVPDLPRQAIANTAKNISKKITKQQDRLSQIENKLAQENVHPRDRKAFNEVINKIRGRIEGMAEEPIDLFGARQKVSELARDASKELQVAKQAKKLREEQDKVIDEAQLPTEQRRRDMRRNLRDPGLRFDEQAGGLDEDTLPSVTQVGDEPEEGLAGVARDAISGLRNTIQPKRLPKGVSRDDLSPQQMINKVTGINARTIKSAILNEFFGSKNGVGGNPEVRNWINHTVQMRTNKKLRRKRQKGEQITKEVEKEARESAEQYAESKLNTVAQRVANTRASFNIDLDNIDINGGNGLGDDSGKGYIRTPGAPVSNEEITSPSERAEYIDRKRNVQQKVLQKRFTEDEAKTINRVRSRARREVQQEQKEDISGRPGGLMGSYPLSADTRFKASMMQDHPELWDKYQQVQEEVNQKLESPEYAPDFLQPVDEDGSVDKSLRSSLKPYQDKIEIEAVKDATEGKDTWLGGENIWGSVSDQPNPKAYRNNIGSVLNAAKRFHISSDARYIRFTTGNVGGNQELSNKSFRVSTENLTPTQLERVTEDLPDGMRQTINANARFRNIPITSNDPIGINDGQAIAEEENAEVQVAKEMEGLSPQEEYGESYVVRQQAEDGEGYTNMTYGDFIRNENVGTTDAMREIISQATNKGFDELSSVDAVKEAAKELDKNGSEPSDRARMLQQILNSSIKTPHRGTAIKFGSVYSQSN